MICSLHRKKMINRVTNGNSAKIREAQQAKGMYTVWKSIKQDLTDSGTDLQRMFGVCRIPYLLKNNITMEELAELHQRPPRGLLCDGELDETHNFRNWVKFLPGYRQPLPIW